MNQLCKMFGVIVLFMISCTYVYADNAERDVSLGNITGRITDTDKQSLPGETIVIENLKSGATSDVNGFYTIANLKPGIYDIRVSYVGYEPKVIKINVINGKTVEEDVVLKEGVTLNEINVTGAFSEQKRALQQQKSKMGIVNVVSSDQVGKFPDSNIGDALKRISGVNVQYDQGEARYGQVRGTSADYTS